MENSALQLHGEVSHSSQLLPTRETVAYVLRKKRTYLMHADM